MKRTRQIRTSVFPQRLGRRTMLRGAIASAGVCVGLPLLDIMLNDHGTALAAGDPIPLRFGVFFWGGGVDHNAWLPDNTGMEWALPESLQPFEDLREYLTLVTGVNHERSRPGHIPHRGIALSASHDPDKGDDGYRGQNHPEPSVDAIAAEAWKDLTPFENIAIGICRKGPYKSNSSWKKGGQTYNRHEPSPRVLFERLFSGGVGGGTDEETANVLGASKTMGKSMLDVIKEDANSLMQRVGSNDRARVDQHLEGLRALERRLDYEVVCEEPENPAASDFGDEGSNEQKEAKHELMIDLLATALACDLSRVFSYEWSATQSGAVYWEVDSSSEHHPLTHKGSSPELRKVVTFIMKNYASLARRLRDTPEGAGNLLDNTLILGTSEHSNADIHNMVDHPFVFLGKAGGAIRAGLHHRDPKTDHWTVNRGTSNLNGPRVLLTAVRAVGVEIEEIGQDGPSGDRRARDSITELLT